MSPDRPGHVLTSAEELLLAELNRLAAPTRAQAKDALWVYGSMEDVVIDAGRWYLPTVAPVLVGGISGVATQARERRATYVEGFLYDLDDRVQTGAWVANGDLIVAGTSGGWRSSAYRYASTSSTRSAGGLAPRRCCTVKSSTAGGCSSSGCLATRWSTRAEHGHAIASARPGRSDVNEDRCSDENRGIARGQYASGSGLLTGASLHGSLIVRCSSPATRVRLGSASARCFTASR